MNRHRTTSRGIEINPEDNIMQQHNGKKQRNDDGETDTASENDDDDHQRAPHDTDALNINQNGQRHRSLSSKVSIREINFSRTILNKKLSCLRYFCRKNCPFPEKNYPVRSLDFFLAVQKIENTLKMKKKCLESKKSLD